MIDPRKIRLSATRLSDAPDEIDLTGGPKPLSLALMVRRVGQRERTDDLRRRSPPHRRGALSNVWGNFRQRDMAPLECEPPEYIRRRDELIDLLPPTTEPPSMTLAGLRACVTAAMKPPPLSRCRLCGAHRDHVMPMRKFALVAEELRGNPVSEICSPQPVSESELLRVHTPHTSRQSGPDRLENSPNLRSSPGRPPCSPACCLTNGGVACRCQDRP